MTSSPVKDPLDVNSSSTATSVPAHFTQDGGSLQDAQPSDTRPTANADQPVISSIAGSPLRRPSAHSLVSSRAIIAASPSLSRRPSQFDPSSDRSHPLSALPSRYDGPYPLIARAFAPHVSVLASADCQELVRHKGLHGGLLELLRPYGERISGRAVIRDSTGASRPWDDYGVRFIGPRDGAEAPRIGRRRSSAGTRERNSGLAGEQGQDRVLENEYRPARLRSGGDTAQIEQLVERGLEHDGQDEERVEQDEEDDEGGDEGAAFAVYQRKLLSGTVLSPHETFAHPVTLVIAISSRNPAPIEELRELYARSNSGDHRLPIWVNNEFLRYYVLVHDEDYDDIKKSTALFEQMKRHFGLHCHLLRLRSTQCPADSPEASVVPHAVWTSAAEDLVELGVEADDEEGDQQLHPPESARHIFETDAVAIRSFVREMVTQSIIPSMERLVATWNDQVASRRRGLSGRFMSLSKRFTPFGGRSSSPASASSGSNYDSAGGFYRPDAPEAVMRKLADYAMMLRDYGLAKSTYEILCGDYKNDKAWRYYAGANEMTAITTLLTTSAASAGTGGGTTSSNSTSMPAAKRAELVEQYIENAYYSYSTRCNSSFYALRTIFLITDLLMVHRHTPQAPTPRSKTGSTSDLSTSDTLNASSTTLSAPASTPEDPSAPLAAMAAARWLIRALDDRCVGPLGHALVSQRVAECLAPSLSTKGGGTTTHDAPHTGSAPKKYAEFDVGFASPGSRSRKAAFWFTLAAAAWLEMDRKRQAGACLKRALSLYAEGHVVLDPQTGSGLDESRAVVEDMATAPQVELIQDRGQVPGELDDPLGATVQNDEASREATLEDVGPSPYVEGSPYTTPAKAFDGMTAYLIHLRDSV